MIIRNVNSIALLSLVSLVACSKSSNKGGSTAVDSSVSSSVTSLKDLSLSGVLAITLPTSVKGSGTTSLTDSNKSFEACKLRQEMREGLSNIAQAATMLCLMESDSAVKFGTKYNIDFSAMGGGAGAGAGAGPGGAGAGAGGAGNFPGGPGLVDGMPSSLQLWIDNSSSEKITVYMCTDKKLTQMIEVTGATKGQAKGKVIMTQSMSMGDFSMKFARAMEFDNGYTTVGTNTLTLKELVETSSTQFGSEKARRLLSMALTETGVSKVLSSFSGNQQGNKSTFSSVGAFDSSYGSVIAKGSLQPASGTTIDFGGESYFDKSSLVVDPIAYPDAFGTNGNVALTVADLPGLLSDSFTPDSFPATAWDCSGTTDMQFSMGSGAGASGGATASSCGGTWDQLPEQDCAAPGFAAGAAVNVDPSTLPPVDHVEVHAGATGGKK